MYVESILKNIEHALDDIEFIAKDNSDGVISVDIACTDGIVFAVAFQSEEDRGLLWNELSEAPPVPFVGIGNTFVRVKHLRDVKVEKIEQDTPAIILSFTSPAKIIRPYKDARILERDYSALVGIISQYQDMCANVFLTMTLH